MKKEYFKLFLKRFLLWFVIGQLLLASMISFTVTTRKQQAELIATHTMNQLQLILNERFAKTETLESFLIASGEDTMRSILEAKNGHIFLQEFDLMATQLCDDESIRALQLLPNGVLLYTYPFESNKDAIGDDVLNRETRKEDAVKAKESGKMVVSGPLELIQGGQALIARNPIYFSDGSFWGFSAIVLNLPDVFLPTGLDNLNAQNYDYQLYWLKEKTPQVINSTLPSQNLDTVKVQQKILDKTWTLSVIPKDGWYSIMGVCLSFLLVFFFAILLAFFMARSCISALQTKEALEKEKQARETAVQAYQAADLANSTKSTFLSTISHDIRTPMNAIVGLCTLLNCHADNKEYVIECTKKISASSQHLLGLINDILDMSKIESGKVSINVQEFQLARLIDEINTILRPQTKERKQTLDIQVNHIIHEDLIGDKLRVNQILLNLLSNSMKYTPEGGHIVFEVNEISIDSSTMTELQFVVRDDGIGMAPEFIERIFEPFARANDGRIDKIQGTGLGMSITKNLIDLMGGTIEIDSTLHVGTTIYVTLRFRIQQTEKELDYFVKHGVQTLLIVDDEKDVCTSIQTTMQGTGVQIDFSTTGQHALEMLQQTDYDVILLDWFMPELNGIELAKHIRKSVGARIPIFILTALDWMEIEEEAKKCGINGFLEKPFFLSNFRLTLERFYNETAFQIPAENYLSGKRILVAEDNPLNAEILTELLSYEGSLCDVCTDGKLVVQQFLSTDPNTYDLILMDIQMPELNGLDATKCIRSSNHPRAKCIPIIAMTANAFAEDRKASKDAGMDAHIAKPIDLNQLQITVKHVLDCNKKEIL